MPKNLKLSTRIVLVGLFATVCFSCVLAWLQSRVSTWIYETKGEETSHVVQTAWGILDYYGSEARAGRMSVEQAQQRAKDTVKKLHYSNGEYFWINDRHPRMVMHPTNPSLDGKDLSDYKDPNGVLLFVKMVEVCSQHGGGVVKYLWAKPGSAQPVPKISFVQPYNEWGWIVGSGIYVDDVKAELARMTSIVVGLGALACALTLTTAFVMARSISRPIQNVVEELMENASQTVAGASQIASASQSLAQDASDQAVSLEETSAAGGEITSITGRTAENSRTVAEHMKKTSVSVASANARLEEMVRCMSDIDRSSGKIMNIIKVIDGIAFQTNILALNAAVEAARAGEAGTGFAVVADEVRSLAQRSAQAARETSVLIEESVSHSKQGSVKLEQVSGAIAGITTTAAEIGKLIEDVHWSSEKQAQGVEQISKSIARMEQVTQGTASAAEESASASEQMSAQAESLQGVVKQLEALISGSEDTSQRRRLMSVRTPRPGRGR